MDVLVGLAYLVIGRVFAWPATHVHAWRLAAWIASGAVFAVHARYEMLHLHRSARGTALHVALAVAIGALGLALAGMAHSLTHGSRVGGAWLVALVAWPAITAIPAFLVAWAGAALLTRLRHAA